MKIFSYPYAGGSSAAYKKFAAELSVTAIDFELMDLAGRGTRVTEPLSTSFDNGVQSGIDKISSFTDPYILHGHCMGALMAFQALQTMATRQTRLPEVLVLSGRNAPHHKNMWSLNASALDDRDLFKELELVGGTPKGLSFAMAKSFMSIFRNDQAMAKNYRLNPERIDVPILVLGGDADEMTNPEALGEWQQYCNRKVEVSLLSGGHYFIFDHPREISRLVKDFRHVISSLDGRGKPHAENS